MLRSSRCRELHDSKLPAVSLIEVIRAKHSSVFARVAAVSVSAGWNPHLLRRPSGFPRLSGAAPRADRPVIEGPHGYQAPVDTGQRLTPETREGFGDGRDSAETGDSGTRWDQDWIVTAPRIESILVIQSEYLHSYIIYTYTHLHALSNKKAEVAYEHRTKK